MYGVRCGIKPRQARGKFLATSSLGNRFVIDYRRVREKFHARKKRTRIRSLRSECELVRRLVVMMRRRAQRAGSRVNWLT